MTAESEMFFYENNVISYPLQLFFWKDQILFEHSYFKTAQFFFKIGSIAATALKFINNARTLEN